MRRMSILLLCLVALAGPAFPLSAQEPSECDRLTADGVGPEANPGAALAACAADLAARPGDPRLVYQYALALERAGRIEDARRMYEWAAADGHGPAAEALERLASTVLPETGSAWTDAERSALAESMSGISTAMRRLEKELPPDPSDPLAIIAEIGTDPEAITEWVGTHTRLVPYAGSLRGARGVLSDRSGNSLDRALALAALLSVAGEDVRLARATLDEEQAKALLDASGDTPPAIPTFPSPTSDEMLELFRSSGVPEDVARQAIDQALALRTRMKAAVAEQVPVLMPLLKESTEAFEASANPALEQLALRQVQDHFWVQVQRGEGWLDFDPDAGQLGALTASETLAPDEMPQALRHAVTVRVVVEIETTSGRREETLVSWTGFTANRNDMLVTLSHTSDSIDALTQLVNAGTSPERFLATIDTTTTWTPLLRIGDQIHFDKLFTIDGQVRTVDPSAFTQAGRGADLAFGAAGALLGNDASPPVDPGVPTAEWIEIERAVPGRPPELERRTLFDLVGPAKRAGVSMVDLRADQLRDRALRLTGSTDILILGANPSGAQLARAATAVIGAAADSLHALSLQPELPDVASIREGARLVLPLRQFAQARLAGGHAPAISAPNIFMLHQRLVWGAGEQAHARTEIDIVFNDVVAAGEAFDARLQQGVTDSVLEAAMMADAESTAEDTVLDLAAGRHWTLLTKGDEQRLSPLPSDLRVRIETELEAGRLVLASLDSSSRGWWRIEPTTGNVLAMGKDGGGAALSENTIIVHVISAGVCIAAAGAVIGGANKAGALGCVLMAGGTTALTLAGVIGGGLGGIALAAAYALIGGSVGAMPNL
jgi:hypothetical protein